MYGKEKKWAEQTCAMKAFADCNTAVEFKRCAPFYCWYGPCFGPLSQSCVTLGIAAHQTDCPGLCILQKQNDKKKIGGLPDKTPIHQPVIQRINQDMIKNCGRAGQHANKLIADTFEVFMPINGRTMFEFGAGNMANYTFMIFSTNIFSKKHPQCKLALRPGKGVLGPKQTMNFRVFIDSKYWESLSIGSTVDVNIKFTYNHGIPKQNTAVKPEHVDSTSQRDHTTKTFHATVSDAVGSQTRTKKGLTGKWLLYIVVAFVLLWIGISLLLYESSQTNYYDKYRKYLQDAARYQKMRRVHMRTNEKKRSHKTQ